MLWKKGYRHTAVSEVSTVVVVIETIARATWSESRGIEGEEKTRKDEIEHERMLGEYP